MATAARGLCQGEARTNSWRFDCHEALVGIGWRRAVSRGQHRLRKFRSVGRCRAGRPLTHATTLISVVLPGSSPGCSMGVVGWNGVASHVPQLCDDLFVGQRSPGLICVTLSK